MYIAHHFTTLNNSNNYLKINLINLEVESSQVKSSFISDIRIHNDT